MNQPADRERLPPSGRLALFAGFASLFIGIGLARFGYTPLLPAVIEAGWFEPGRAAYLGAANFAGYFVGAVFAWRLPVRFTPRTTLRALLSLTALSFVAAAFPVSFEWMLFWRFLPGMTGGWIMVLAAPLVLTAIPPERQSLAGGVFFVGVAGGVVASGTLVPLLLSAGLRETWLGIAALMAFVLCLAWRGIPAGEVELPRDDSGRRGGMTPAMRGLATAYALFAFAIAAHMLFLVDYVARGLGQGIGVGSLAWIALGAGGLAGPILAPAAARRFGVRRVLLAGYAALAFATAVPALADGLAAALLSAVLVGGLVTAQSAMTLAAVTQTIAERRLRTRIWGIATAAFAVAQTAAAYAYSWLFASGYAYATLFLLAAAASALALASVWISGRIPPSAASPGGRSSDPVSRAEPGGRHAAPRISCSRLAVRAKAKTPSPAGQSSSGSASAEQTSAHPAS